MGWAPGCSVTLKGRKLPVGGTEAARAFVEPREAESPVPPELTRATKEANAPASPSRDFDEKHTQTAGLPLFGEGEADGGHR